MGYQERSVDLARDDFLYFTMKFLAFCIGGPNERTFEFTLLSATR